MKAGSYLGCGNCYFCKFFHFKELKTLAHVPLAQGVLMLWLESTGCSALTDFHND